MPAPNFQCPYCSAPLRIRNRTLIGKQLACPDCGKPILVASAGPRELTLQKKPPERRRRSSRKKTAETREKLRRLSRWLRVLQSPVGISWLVAGILAVMLLLAAWPFGNSDSHDTKKNPATKKFAQQNLAAGNEEKQAVGKSDQTQLVQQSNSSDDAVDLKNDFPPPVAAKKPVSVIESDQERNLESIPDRDPVAATIPPEPIDITKALSQPILQYRQKKAVSLRILLMELEEMAGVPIRYNASERGDGSTYLDEPVSLQLQKTTVGEILKTLLKQVHLEYELGYNEIRIVSPNPDKPEPKKSRVEGPESRAGRKQR